MERGDVETGNSTHVLQEQGPQCLKDDGGAQDSRDDEKAAENLESRKLTKAETILLLSVIMIGAGVLALPSVVASCGYIAAPALCVFAAFAYAEVAQTLHVAMMFDETITSFEGLGSFAIGRVGLFKVRTSRTSMFFGYMVVYTILLA
jgi:amino acid permease